MADIESAEQVAEWMTYDVAPHIVQRLGSSHEALRAERDALRADLETADEVINRLTVERDAALVARDDAFAEAAKFRAEYTASLARVTAERDAARGRAERLAPLVAAQFIHELRAPDGTSLGFYCGRCGAGEPNEFQASVDVVHAAACPLAADEAKGAVKP